MHGVLYHASIPGLRFIRIIHHAGHHTALFPPEHYVQTQGYPSMRFREPSLPFRTADNALDSRLTEYAQVGLHFVVGIPFILLPAWVFGGGPSAFFWSVLGTLAFVSWLLAYVHGVIHTPGDRLIEHQRWFQWLDRHHYIHHIGPPRAGEPPALRRPPHRPRAPLPARGRQGAYRMKRPAPGGATHLVLTPVELLRRLAALVPRRASTSPAPRLRAVLNTGFAAPVVGSP